MEKNEMKRIRYQNILVFASACWCLFTGCRAELDKFVFYKNRAIVEKNTPDFDPKYVQDTTRKHVAILFDINTDGTMQIVDSPPEIRSGSMPYKPMKSGDFLIVYRDANGIELGRYAMKDPRDIRVSDSTIAMPGIVRPATSTTTELLFPYDTSIKRIVFYPMVDDTMGFNVTW